MADAITALPVPQGDAVATLPVPDSGPAINPNSVASPMQTGFRNGLNSLGASINAIVGQTGETLGLNDFAADRFKDVENYTAALDHSGPAPKDVGSIKSFTDLTNFVGNMMGEGAATMAPAMGLSLGLRRPVAGTMAGFAPIEAGSQVQRLREDPTAMAKGPGAVLANATATGLANAGLYATVGAPGQISRKVLGTAAKESLLAGTAKSAAGQAAVMPATDLVGQAMHQQLNPEKQIDTSNLANEAASGAIAGGVFGVGGHVAAMAPNAVRAGAGKVADTASQLRERFARRKEAEKPPHPDDMPPDDIKDEAGLINFFKGHADKLDAFKESVKDNPIYKGVTNPEELFNKARETYNESTIKPKVDAAVEGLKGWTDQIKRNSDERKAKKMADEEETRFNNADDVTEKFSHMEKRPDFNEMAMDVLARKPINVSGRTPEVANFLAKHGYAETSPGKWESTVRHAEKERDDVDAQIHDIVLGSTPIDHVMATPAKRLLELSGLFRKLVEDPESMAGTRVPHELKAVYGEKLHPMIREIGEAMGHKPDQMARVDELFKTDKEDFGNKQREIRKLIAANLKDEYFSDPETRMISYDEMSKRMMDRINSSKHDPEFHDDLVHMFGPEKAEHVAEKLDQLREDTQSPDAEWLDEGAKHIEGQEFNDTPHGQELAKKAAEQARQMLGNEARVTLERDRTRGKIKIHVANQDLTGLTPEQFSAAREKVKYNRSKLSEGIISVRTKDAPSGAKVNLVNLTSEMMRTEKSDLEGTAYVADMFNRGISKLLNSSLLKLDPDPKVAKTDKGFTKFGESQIIRKTAEGHWDLPDDTPVAYYQGRVYHYGEIKQGNLPQGKTLDNLRAAIKEAKASGDKAAISKANRDLIDYYQEGKDLRKAVEHMEEDAMEYLEKTEGDPNAEREALMPLHEKMESIREDLKSGNEKIKAILEEIKSIGGDAEMKTAATAPLREQMAPRFREAGFVRQAIERVENEAERLRQRSPERDDIKPVIEDTRNSDNTLHMEEPSDGKPRTFEEDTYAPLNAQPAAGPRGTFGEAVDKGSNVDLAALRKEYQRATPERKAEIAAIAKEALGRAADFTKPEGGRSQAPTFSELKAKLLQEPRKPLTKEEQKVENERLKALEKAIKSDPLSEENWLAALGGKDFAEMRRMMNEKAVPKAEFEAWMEKKFPDPAKRYAPPEPPKKPPPPPKKAPEPKKSDKPDTDEKFSYMEKDGPLDEKIAARVDARLIKEDYNIPTAEGSLQFLKAAYKRGAELERLVFADESEPTAEQNKAHSAAWRLFDKDADLEMFLKESPDWKKIPEARQKEMLKEVNEMGRATKLGKFPKLGDGKFSTMNVGKGKIDPKVEKEVTDYIEKVLGPKASVEFIKKMEAAGSFAKIKGVETIKIAADAADKMSVGFHEAAHAFFARLIKADPKAAHTLLRAANSAPVIARLNELLKGHPKALEQIRKAEGGGAEERLAYMYQFWAAGKKGLLNIGPETKTFFDKVKGFFRQVGAIWADDFVTADAVERSGQILDAFHKGDFAEPSTVKAVLHDKFPKSALESFNQHLPWLGRIMDKFLFTASGAVRDMNNPALTGIIDNMHTPIEATNTKPGFRQAIHVEYNRRINKVADIFKSMPTDSKGKPLAERQQLVWNDMHTGEAPKTPEGKEIAKILAEADSYLREKGVKLIVKNKDGAGFKYQDLGHLEHYFPRVPDTEYLMTDEGREAFISLLEKHKIQDPQQVYSKYVRGADTGRPHGEEDPSIGLTYFTPALNERILKTISDKDMAPFMSKDLFGTLSQYLHRAVRRAEYTERFGNTGEAIANARKEALTQGITDAQIKTFDEAIRALDGSLGADMSPKLKNIYSGLMTYQNIRLLPFQVLSSIIDPAGIMVRGGTMKEAFGTLKDGIKALAGFKGADAEMLAKTIGAIDSAQDMGLMSEMNGSEYMPKLFRGINDKFFRYNGMERWNNSMRASAAVAAREFIIRHATKPNEHSKRFLAELNLEAKDVKVSKDGQLDYSNDKIVQAMNTWVDGAILRPNAALRPIYMSDPNWMLIGHLKQYTYLFQKVIISRVYNEMAHGNYSPAYALAGYVPVMIAMDMLRVGLTPGGMDDAARAGWGPLDYLWRGISRVGIFGPSQFGLDAAGDFSHGSVAGSALVGPTIQQALKLGHAAAEPGGNIKSELLNAVPFARYGR